MSLDTTLCKNLLNLSSAQHVLFTLAFQPMQPTPETNPTYDETDYSDLPPLVDDSDSESTTPPQQVFVTYWANAPHPPPTVVSISYINENGECVVVPITVNAAERPVLTIRNDNIGVQFRRHNNF